MKGVARSKFGDLQYTPHEQPVNTLTQTFVAAVKPRGKLSTDDLQPILDRFSMARGLSNLIGQPDVSAVGASA